MQNPAIRTLKAIREIHNEPHQWQVHMGDWHSVMTQTTWQFATLSAISILATAAVTICRFSAVACWFLIFFFKHSFRTGCWVWKKEHGATVLTVRIRIAWMFITGNRFGLKNSAMSLILISLHFAASDFPCVFFSICCWTQICRIDSSVVTKTDLWI